MHKEIMNTEVNINTLVSLRNPAVQCVVQPGPSKIAWQAAVNLSVVDSCNELPRLYKTKFQGLFISNLWI